MNTPNYEYTEPAPAAPTETANGQVLIENDSLGMQEENNA